MGGFDLRRRWKVAVSECGGVFSFHVADLDVTQKDRDDHRLNWACENKEFYEQHEGISFEFTAEDFEEFLAGEYREREYTKIKDVLRDGVFRILGAKIEEGEADKIIAMTQSGYQAGFFELMEQGEERGLIGSTGYKIGEPPRHLAQVFKDSKGKLNGFYIPPRAFSALARISFPKDVQGQLGAKSVKLSEVMAVLGMPPPRTDCTIGLIGIPSEFNGDRVFVYVKP